MSDTTIHDYFNLDVTALADGERTEPVDCNPDAGPHNPCGLHVLTRDSLLNSYQTNDPDATCLRRGLYMLTWSEDGEYPITTRLFDLPDDDADYPNDARTLNSHLVATANAMLHAFSVANLTYDNALLGACLFAVYEDQPIPEDDNA